MNGGLCLPASDNLTLMQSLQSDKDTGEDGDADSVVVILIGAIVAVILVLGCVTTTMVLVIKQRRRFESRSHDTSSLGSGHSSHLGADNDSKCQLVSSVATPGIIHRDFWLAVIDVCKAITYPGI